MKKNTATRIALMSSLCITLFIMSACGYTLQGTKADTRASVLGNGEKTIAITKVEQSSLLPWLPYQLRTKLYTEMNMRRLAKWTDVASADYTMEAYISSFETTTSISGSNDETLLSVVSANLIVNVFDKTHKLVWTSGNVHYSENYQNIYEDEAIEEILKELVYMVYDRMQNTF